MEHIQNDTLTLYKFLVKLRTEHFCRVVDMNENYKKSLDPNFPALVST